MAGKFFLIISRRKVLYSVLNPDKMTKKLVFAMLAVLFLTACREKKKPSLSGEEPVDIKDFISSFELVRPTYEIADSLLTRKEKDSLLIGYKIFTRFVPDTVLSKTFGKNVKPKIYLMKRVEGERQETYLFAKAMLADKKVVYVLCFDNDKKFMAAMPLLKEDANPSTTQVGGIDRRYSIYKTTYLMKPDGSSGEGREVYVFNADAKKFLLIMTDALDDRVNEVINPIDTLSKKNKFSADYVKDKMNMVSIRDAGKPDKINFFIHFERTSNGCSGELKGVASFNKPTTAVYRQAGDGCVLQFNFTASSVTLKEIEPCGSHRGVKCSFDGTYPRKRAMKKKMVRK